MHFENRGLQKNLVLRSCHPAEHKKILDHNNESF